MHGNLWSKYNGEETVRSGVDCSEMCKMMFMMKSK
jgi:hypothetical protein